MAGPHFHTLDAVRHQAFLAEGRRDPVTRHFLQAGDVVAVCRHCRIAFLRESWQAVADDMRSGHGGMANTFETLPNAQELVIRPGARRRTPATADARGGGVRLGTRPGGPVLQTPPLPLPTPVPRLPSPWRRRVAPVLLTVTASVGLFVLVGAIDGAGGSAATNAADTTTVTRGLVSVDDLVLGVRSAPADAERWRSLGQAWSSQGESVAAGGAFGVAALLDPDDPRSLSEPTSLSNVPDVVRQLGLSDDEWVGGLGRRAYDRREWALATDLFRIARQLDNTDGEWRRRLADAELQTAFYYTRNRPYDAAAWSALGNAYGAAGLTDEAADAYAVAHVLVPDDGRWNTYPAHAAPDALRRLGQDPTTDWWSGRIAALTPDTVAAAAMEPQRPPAVEPPREEPVARPEPPRPRRPSSAEALDALRVRVSGNVDQADRALNSGGSDAYARAGTELRAAWADVQRYREEYGASTGADRLATRVQTLFQEASEACQAEVTVAQRRGEPAPRCP
jgi:tetratricopeptide (TPR) repeat protein